MIDLIYCGHEQYDECKKELQAGFPDCAIEDASDDIHEGRFQIEVPDERRKELLMFLLENGYYNISLKLQLMSYDEKGVKELEGLMEELAKKKGKVNEV